MHHSEQAGERMAEEAALAGRDGPGIASRPILWACAGPADRAHRGRPGRGGPAVTVVFSTLGWCALLVSTSSVPAGRGSSGSSPAR